MILAAVICAFFATFLAGVLIGGMARVSKDADELLPPWPAPPWETQMWEERPALRIVPPAPPGQWDPLLMSSDTRGKAPYDWADDE